MVGHESKAFRVCHRRGAEGQIFHMSFLFFHFAIENCSWRLMAENFKWKMENLTATSNLDI